MHFSCSKLSSSVQAKSAKDCILKMETVSEETDETKLWLEMIPESNTLKSDGVVQAIDNEANALVAIFCEFSKTR
ncbi:MAG: four helix bundle protein [Bacteroidetes bacterium]|nr:MAG: four helix bundle protein [Bacteroidota bacterium]